MDGDLLPLQSGELYVASLVMEDVVLFERQVNEITVGSLYDDDNPVDTLALQFGEAQKADPHITLIFSILILYFFNFHDQSFGFWLFCIYMILSNLYLGDLKFRLNYCLFDTPKYVISIIFFNLTICFFRSFLLPHSPHLRRKQRKSETMKLMIYSEGFQIYD